MTLSRRQWLIIRALLGPAWLDALDWTDGEPDPNAGYLLDLQVDAERLPGGPNERGES